MMNMYIANNRLSSPKFFTDLWNMDYLVVFFMNKFAGTKQMVIDIFLIFCHEILVMILFRILTKSKGVHVLVS